MKCRRAFTLLELLVVVAIIGLLISVLVPALGNARRQGYKSKNMGNLRAIVQSFNAWADANNVSKYPKNGLGGVTADTVKARFEALTKTTKGEPLAPRTLVNPASDREPPAAGTTTLDAAKNISYALLEAASPDWGQTAGSATPLVCDENTGTAASPKSAWAADKWEGYIAWGDLHVTLELSDKIVSGIGGKGVENDDIWAAPDALMKNPAE